MGARSVWGCYRVDEIFGSVKRPKDARVEVHVAACYGSVVLFLFSFSNFDSERRRASGLALLQVQEAFGVGVGYAFFVGWAYR